jgi:hypothetical protein
MIHVLLDSSIYRNDPTRQRLGFRTLAGLCEKKLVTLHIPSIVIREFTTHLVLEAEAVLAEAVRSVKKLSRVGGPDKERAFVEGSFNELKSFTGRYGEYAAQNFDDWLIRLNAIKHEVRADCLADVLNRYFKGEPPFKTIKSREDFPDAFIWQIVRDLAQKQQLLTVIADKNLRSAISQISRVVAFDSLEALIESSAIQDLFPENFVRKHEVDILNLFKLTPTVFDLPIIDGVEAELMDTSVLHTINDNEDEAEIVEIEDVDKVKIDFAGAQYFGNNIFRIPFKARVRAVLDYFLMKSTYYGMSDEERDVIDVQDSDWNDSTMWVRESRYLEVQGELAISIDMTELIMKSDGGLLDHDTVLYGSDITVDELDHPEVLEMS